MLSTFFFYSGLFLPSIIIVGALVICATLLACYAAWQFLFATADFIGLSKINCSNRGGTGLQILDHIDKLTVVGLVANSPAQKAGIKVGDVITHIDGDKISSLSSYSVSNRLGNECYESGTSLSIHVQRPGEKGTLRFCFPRAPLAVANGRQSAGKGRNVTSGINGCNTTHVTSTYQRKEVRASTLQTAEGREGQNDTPEATGQTNAHSVLEQDTSSHHAVTSV